MIDVFRKNEVIGSRPRCGAGLGYILHIRTGEGVWGKKVGELSLVTIHTESQGV